MASGWSAKSVADCGAGNDTIVGLGGRDLLFGGTGNDSVNGGEDDDIVIGTKIRLAGETAHRPAFGFRFATKLPNASNESGLGLDTTDFFASTLVAKTIRSVRVVGNLARLLRQDSLRQKLLAATDPAQFIKLIDQAEG